MVSVVETVEFTIPDYLVSALINGDLSGLEDNEESLVAETEQRASNLCKCYGGTNWHFSMPESEPEFMSHNDVTGWIGGNCVVMTLVIMGEK